MRCYLSKKSFRNLNWFLKLRSDVNFLSTWECDLTVAPTPGIVAYKFSPPECETTTENETATAKTFLRSPLQYFGLFQLENETTKIKANETKNEPRTFPTDTGRFSSGSFQLTADVVQYQKSSAVLSTWFSIIKSIWNQN